MAQGLTYYCPSCWKEIPFEGDTCPHCGYDLLSYRALGYEDKLLLATRHPVPEYRYLAIQALGMLGSRRALPLFAEILREKEADVYLIYEVLQALSHIDDQRSRDLLKEATRHPLPLVQKRAIELLQNMKGRESAG